MTKENPSSTSPEPQRIDAEAGHSVARIHEQIRREKPDPSPGAEPIPLGGIALVGVILAAAFMYLGMFSGGFRGDVYDERGGAGIAVAGDGGAGAEEDPMVTLIRNGKRIYQANCQACHQSGGTGVSGVYPPLAGSEWVLENDQRLIALVLGGLQGPIEVKGNLYNNVMVAWAPTLTDDKIASVLSYIRQEWGNQGAPIDKNAVAAVRAAHGSRTSAWTAEELNKVFAK